MRRIAPLAAIAAALAIAACGKEEAPPVRSQQAQVDTAAQAYNPVMFDTVKWASESEAIARGRDIFKWACAECHGPEGLGDGGRVIDGDTLHPPSFRQPGWRFANDPAALQKQVFVGNTLGMPHWGLREMRPRDIVAVEKYIRLELIRGGASQSGTPGAE